MQPSQTAIVGIDTLPLNYCRQIEPNMINTSPVILEADPTMSNCKSLIKQVVEEYNTEWLWTKMK